MAHIQTQLYKRTFVITNVQQLEMISNVGEVKTKDKKKPIVPNNNDGTNANGKNDKTKMNLFTPFAKPIPTVIIFCLIIERINNAKNIKANIRTIDPIVIPIITTIL